METLFLYAKSCPLRFHMNYSLCSSHHSKESPANRNFTLSSFEEFRFYFTKNGHGNAASVADRRYCIQRHNAHLLQFEGFMCGRAHFSFAWSLWSKVCLSLPVSRGTPQWTWTGTNSVVKSISVGSSLQILQRDVRAGPASQNCVQPHPLHPLPQLQPAHLTWWVHFWRKWIPWPSLNHERRWAPSSIFDIKLLSQQEPDALQPGLSPHYEPGDIKCRTDTDWESCVKGWGNLGWHPASLAYNLELSHLLYLTSPHNTFHFRVQFSESYLLFKNKTKHTNKPIIIISCEAQKSSTMTINEFSPFHVS